MERLREKIRQIFHGDRREHIGQVATSLSALAMQTLLQEIEYTYIRTGQHVSVLPDSRVIVYQNENKQGERILFSPRKVYEEGIYVDVATINGDRILAIAQGEYIRDQNGQWTDGKGSETVTPYLMKLFDPLREAKNHAETLVKKKRKLEARVARRNKWQMNDVSEIPRSLPVVRAVTNDEDPERPIAEFATFRKSSRAEMTDSGVGHMYRYKVLGKPEARAILDDIVLEIYQIEPVIQDQIPPFAVLKRASMDNGAEEISLVAGTTFSQAELHDFLSSSLIGEAFAEWIEKYRMEHVYNIGKQREEPSSV